MNLEFLGKFLANETSFVLSMFDILGFQQKSKCEVLYGLLKILPRGFKTYQKN